MSFWEDMGDAGKYLIEQGTDIYKATLDAKTAQKANEAGAVIAKAKANDIITIGKIEVSLTKVLAITALTFGVLFVAKTAKG